MARIIHIPTGPGRLAFPLLALAALVLAAAPDPARAQEFRINEFMAVNSSIIRDEDGDSSDWIELFNGSNTTVNLSGWYLTDETNLLRKWAFPATNMPPGSYLLVFASGKDRAVPGSRLHTNFKLDGGGDYLALVCDTNVSQAFDPEYPRQDADISYGYGEFGELRYFATPTPSNQNDYAHVAPASPEFTPDGGFFMHPVQVAVTSRTAGASIYYTMDGTFPSAESTPYLGPIVVTSVTPLRAIAIKPGEEPSAIMTRTFFVTNRAFTLPVVSISTTPSWLFGSGIYDSWGSYPEGTEREIFLELYDTNGERQVAMGAGLNIHGGWTRNYAQKGLGIHARSEYGSGKIEYKFFPEKNISEFNSIILRASGTDWGDTLFRDALIQSLTIDPMNTDYQAYTPCATYICGRYWGIYNIREKLTKFYPEENYGVAHTNLDLIKYYNGQVLEAGSMDDYNSLTAYIGANDMTQTQHYEYVSSHMDIDNYLDYEITEIYSGNIDWPQNNAKYWRRRVPDSKWRWVFMDVDYAFSLFESTHYTEVWRNSIKRCTTTEPDGYWTTEAATWLMRAMLVNPTFRDEFIQRFGSHLNSTFSADRVIGMMNTFTNRIRDEVVAGYIPRWGGASLAGYGTVFNSENDWKSRLAVVTNFAVQRPGWLRQHMTNRFALAGTMLVNLQIPQPGTGCVVIADVPFTNRSYSGTWFRDAALRFQAVPSEGCRFAGWQGDAPPAAGPSFSVVPSNNLAITALFAPVPESEGGIVISELMYDPPPSTSALYSASDFEFVELLNTGTSAVQMAGAMFTDGISFEFPAVVIDTGKYAVVARNLAAFASRYPTNGLTVLGPFTGNLDDKGEKVTLKMTEWGPKAFSFSYDNARGWPVPAAGAGHSLVPRVLQGQWGEYLDYCGNWRASSFIGGSPGLPDPEPLTTVVLNEIMAHTDYTNPVPPGYDSNDWIELFNSTNISISLADWYLSDDEDDLAKWAIPATNVMAAGGRIVFDEITGFHNPTNTGFGISKDGETIFLSHLPGSGSNRVADCIALKGQDNGVSAGRYPDAQAWHFALWPTRGSSNQLHQAGAVLIGEIMYHPRPTLVDFEGNNGDEYVEIHNASTSSVPMWTEAGSWRLWGGIRYVFPAGVTLAPGERVVVVSFDPADSAKMTAFLRIYAPTNSGARVFGPYSDSLSNEGERIALEKPQLPDVPGDPVSWIISDEVIYFDRQPWPAEADGSGRPLERLSPGAPESTPLSWNAGVAPTPGNPPARVGITQPYSGLTVAAGASTSVVAIVNTNLAAAPFAQVEFFRNGVSAGTNTSPPYEAVVSFPGQGDHFLVAVLTDAAGVWTSPPVAVAAYAPPAVENHIEPAAVMDMMADFGGRLTSGGFGDAFIYWGPSDGGTTAGAWSNCLHAGSVFNGVFTRETGGLSVGTPVFFRCFVTNLAGQGWAGSTASFMPSYTNWQNRLRIGVPGYGGGGSLSNFPLKVTLDSGIRGFSYGQFAGATGGDLRFGDASTTNAYAFEIEEWNTSGTSVAWVRLPVLAGTNTACWAYWGSPASAVLPPFATNGTAWSPNHSLVLHMASNAAPEAGDSSAYGRVGQVLGPHLWTNGVAGRCLNLSGSASCIDLSSQAAPTGSNWTMSAWFKGLRGSSARRVLAVDESGGQFHVVINNKSYNLGVLVTNFADSGYDLNTPSNEWHMLAAAAAGSNTYFYLDGTLVGTSSAVCSNAVRAIGNNQTNNLLFADYLDEFRLDNTRRSADWITACWSNQAPGASFTAYGNVEWLADLDTDDDGMADSWETRYFGGISAEKGGPLEDFDRDGFPNLKEYIAGTDPAVSAKEFILEITRGTGGPVVRFFARDTLSEDYRGKLRFYDLEARDAMPDAPPGWQAISGREDIPGSDSYVAYTNSAGATSRFFRVRAELR